VSDLATLAEFEEWLGGTVVAEATLRQAILDQAEALFEAACGRAHAPFAAADTGREETLTGTGAPSIFLDYPIDDVTEVLLGFDPANPDETLDPTDPAVLVWEEGGTRLTRVDGGKFGCLGDPAFVRVTYDTQAELPDDAKLAVLRMAATLYRGRGSEEVKSETMGPYSVTYALSSAAATDPVWQTAVNAHARIAL
jgi:hypothetical protein